MFMNPSYIAVNNTLLPSLSLSLSPSLLSHFYAQSENPNVRDFETALTHLRRSHSFDKVLFACLVTKVGIYIIHTSLHVSLIKLVRK